jgi:hypothetical protein
VCLDSKNNAIPYSNILAFAAPNRKNTLKTGPNTSLYSSQSKFVKAMRDQNLEEALDFLDCIKEALQREDQKHNAHNILTLKHVRTALTQVDPFKTPREIEEYVARGCSCTLEQLEKGEMDSKRVNVDSFLKSLILSGLVKKSHP